VRVRDVFAPTDGVVVDLRIRHGQQVAPGEILAVLRRAELDLEFKRVWGELQTARRRLASIEAERIQGRREIEDQRQRYGQLTAQQEELREQITGLEAQYAILQQQQAELEVRSPMAGEVLTWSPQQLLDGRPVGRGQVLMTVGDLRGPWQLELRIPDRRVAHVLRAQRELSEQLQVSFIQANDLGRASKGTLSSVGRRTEISDTEGAFVLATVAVTRDEIPQLIPGAGVAAKIHCGRRAAGYVWFHDLIDAVRGWLLF
jgi:multidrug efflux pump subunit AcrA (membrane-fusion protein)